MTNTEKEARELAKVYGYEVWEYISINAQYSFIKIAKHLQKKVLQARLEEVKNNQGLNLDTQRHSNTIKLIKKYESELKELDEQ